LDLVASAFNSTSSTAVSQTFLWQAEPAANDTASPSGTLNLLFGVGATKPSETGLHIASTGVITFNTAQTFPKTISGVTTATGSGLTGGGTSGTLNLALTSACAKNQVLRWSGTAWACAAVGTGTVTSVATGAGLTGGPITGSGTLSIATGGVTNAMLATSYAQLGTANIFSANQTVNGTLFATSSGLGVQATTTSVNGVGVNALSSSTAGTGVGVVGASNSASGEGVVGTNNAMAGNAVGVFGVTQSPSGTGVSGLNQATTGTGAGVFGFTNSTAGIGVEGQSPSTGIFGQSFAASGGRVWRA
jgi:trimeric autotransporter adhesin